MPEASRLVIEAITVRNGDTTFVSGLSLELAGGDVLGITGPSGSGKSSLIAVLAGLAAPTAGRLLLGGRSVTPQSRAAPGLILQHNHLPEMLTAHETVSLPLQARHVERSAVAERSDRMLVALGLGDHAGQLISELSGGQRQRVAVARALAGDPELIVADEPTAALDAASRACVITQLDAAARAGAIVILASSDPELIDGCTRVVRLPGA